MKLKEIVYVGPAADRWAVRTRNLGIVGRFDDQESAVAAAIDHARASPPSRLVVKDEGGAILMDQRYGEDVWPPEQTAYHYYELTEGSRPHEGSTPLEAGPSSERPGEPD